MKRMFQFDPKSGQFMTPSVFYKRVAENPKVKARLKKKALMIIDNWDHLAEMGNHGLKLNAEGLYTYEYWLEHRREIRKLDLGCCVRYQYPYGLKAAFKETVKYYLSLY